MKTKFQKFVLVLSLAFFGLSEPSFIKGLSANFNPNESESESSSEGKKCEDTLLVREQSIARRSREHKVSPFASVQLTCHDRSVSLKGRPIHMDGMRYQGARNFSKAPVPLRC